MAEDELLREIKERLDELGADVQEHDEALMKIIRRGARNGSVPVADAGELNLARQLELLDRAGAFFESLGGGEKRHMDALIRSSLERRRHLAFLLALDDDDREALAFVLSLDEHQRSALAAHVEVDSDGRADS